uniref:Uncharacterized protein n=1 Tax=Calcidiscus leptoporus TaxID=127549 RepID=A0A7S0IHM0_9EUKA|mmetsp:Transcript_10266/g.23765  ORF Transcript_10266/g.23765 Transcript_10266/m.23765 type:complete len:107 (+) Transcript_10266:250-570(+)
MSHLKMIRLDEAGIRCKALAETVGLAEAEECFPQHKHIGQLQATALTDVILAESQGGKVQLLHFCMEHLIFDHLSEPLRGKAHMLKALGDSSMSDSDQERVHYFLS